jgi:hypothetical protein
MSDDLCRQGAAPGTGSSLLGWQGGLFVAILGYGIFLRIWELGSKPFWVDEAESGINALNILGHGVPVDHYLGLPLYENTLTRPWPESKEYDFKDSSYSERGVSIYHGWLPLFAMAASYALTGVQPDEVGPGLGVRHSSAEMRWRTVAGRIPAVVFGAVFLVALFGAARRLYGPDAAWTALAAGVVCTPAVEFARQARYYSATVALTACCAHLAWRIIQQGRWRDILLGAVAFVLLFHTHALSFVTTCAVCGLAIPWLFGHRQPVAKLAVFAAIVGAGVVPWVVWTGFISAARDVPKARSLLSVEDVQDFAGQLGVFPLLAALALLGLLAAVILRKRLPGRLIRPFADHAGAFCFLAAWALIGVIAFVFFMPAVSFFYGRLVLTIFVPGLLLGAVFFAALARVVSPRFAALLAPAVLIGALVAMRQATFWPASEAPGTPTTFDVIEHLRGLHFKPGTRIYATPNHHLTLTFYTGMPVQSVAPVSRSFLDDYEGELLIVEAGSMAPPGPRYEPLTWQEIQRVAGEAGHSLTETEARDLERLLASRLVREDACARGARVTPALEPLPGYCDRLLRYQREKTEVGVTKFMKKTGNPMFKGYHPQDYLECWLTFYYRFVPDNPEAHLGKHLNYAKRVRGAEATVLPLEWVLYRCPARK